MDPEIDNPRRFVGDTRTRIIHRTDSDDEACTVDDENGPVWSDHLDKLLEQEWTGYRYEMGPLLEGEKPADYGLPKDATERRHAIAVVRKFRLCPICSPEEG